MQQCTECKQKFQPEFILLSGCYAVQDLCAPCRVKLAAMYPEMAPWLRALQTSSQQTVSAPLAFPG